MILPDADRRSYFGRHKISTVSEREFIFGRVEDKFPIGLALTPTRKRRRLNSGQPSFLSPMSNRYSLMRSAKCN
jgi:hypothetical protein